MQRPMCQQQAYSLVLLVVDIGVSRMAKKINQINFEKIGIYIGCIGILIGSEWNGMEWTGLERCAMVLTKGDELC